MKSTFLMPLCELNCLYVKTLVQSFSLAQKPLLSTRRCLCNCIGLFVFFFSNGYNRLFMLSIAIGCFSILKLLCLLKSKFLSKSSYSSDFFCLCLLKLLCTQFTLHIGYFSRHFMLLQGLQILMDVRVLVLIAG